MKNRPPYWSSLSTIQFAVTTAASIVLFIVIKNDQDQFIPILDGANLIFHEAGHPIFGILGNTLGLYGGTIGQLVFPMVITISFWLKRETIGFTVGLMWFFENFLNIARYMADARVQLLPLVGGGEHDWTQIFSNWGVLSSDTKIAGFVNDLGWAGMIGSLIWLGWKWWFGSQEKKIEPKS